MKFNKELLPATGRDIPIEFRLFEISLAITVLILYFYTVYGILFGYQWPVMTIYASASVVYTCLYIAQKRRLSFRMLSLVYYFTAFALLALAWLPSGGMHGAITNMFVLIFVSGLLILQPRDFLVFVSMSLVLVGVFTLVEIANPHLAAPYLNARNWMIDISVSNFIMLTILGVTIFIFKREYLRDKEKVRIINKKLEQEKVKAEMAGNAKTQFLANVSHEMRTPLNGIAGSSELLRQTELSESQQQILSNLSLSNDQLNSLISDVLDITMIESGHLVVAEKEFDLQLMMRELVRTFQPNLAALEPQVSFSYTIDERVPVSVKGDEERLKRILVHLIKNSIKFTEAGTITVLLKQVSLNGDDLTIRFEVEDTGTGISELHRKYIFEPFQNLSGERGETGLGLGLNICKRLIEQMGGQMGFMSEYGKGSLFYFQIPLKVNPDIQAVPSDICLKSLRVLIAEDQQINQVITRKMLQNVGVEDIDIAENGVEAVACTQSKEYDLVLMDLRMPLMDGIEATRKILSTMGHKPAIIAVTANALEIDKEKCMSVGMLDFINKPFTKDILLRSIQRAMSTKST